MAAPLTGQAAATGSPVALSATPIACAAFTIKAPATNAGTVYIGAAGVSTSTGYSLDPGDVFEYERQAQNGQPLYTLTVSDFYMVGTNPDKVVWFASPGG